MVKLRFLANHSHTESIGYEDELEAISVVEIMVFTKAREALIGKADK